LNKKKRGGKEKLERHGEIKNEKKRDLTEKKNEAPNCYMLEYAMFTFAKSSLGHSGYRREKQKRPARKKGRKKNTTRGGG